MFGLKKKSSQHLGSHVRCLTGVEIFQQESCKPYFSEIRNLVSCPDNIFREIYLAVLYKVAEFCQSMPFAENSFEDNFGFLTRQLQLTVAVLKLRRGKLLPKNAQTEDISAEEAQWTYAHFASAMLKDLYCLYTNRNVSLYQANGVDTGLWSPLGGSLYEKTVFYDMTFAKNESLITIDAVMAALARHILPTIVLQWFSSNVKLFNQFWVCITHQALHDNLIESTILEAAYKVEIPLIKSTQINKKNYKKNFIEHLQQAVDDKHEGIIRLNTGLFVTSKIVEEFTSIHQISSIQQFLKSLENDDWLILHENQPYRIVTGQNFEDKIELSGIILKMDILPHIFHGLPINAYYQNQVKI
jgi:hypothetical protein